MNLTGQQIKNTYEGVLNIGATGLTGTFQEITDGLGNNLGIQVSNSTINFTSPVTGLPVVDTSPITIQQTCSLVSTAIGATAGSGANCAIAIGRNASSTAACSIAIGNGAIASGSGTISIGSGNETGAGSILIGSGNNFTASPDSVGIGVGVYLLGATNGINIGRGNALQGPSTIAIGGDYCGLTTRSMSESAITFGNGNQNNMGTRGIVLGNLNYIESGATDGVSVGNCNQILGGCRSLIFGNQSRVHVGATGTIVLGNISNGATGACNSVVIGNTARATVACAIAIGQAAIGGGLNSIAIGNGAVSRDNGVVIGAGACNVAGPYGSFSVAIGAGAIALDFSGIAIGGNAIATEGTAIGGGAISCGDGGTIAIAYQAKACVNSISLGAFSCATTGCSLSIGWAAQSNQACSISIGVNSLSCHTGAAIIGPGLTSIRTNTTHVNSLVAFGQAASLAHTVGLTGGSVTVDFDNSNVQTLTLGANITTLTKTNPIDGGVYTLFITQGGGGGYTVAFGDDVKFAGGTGPTLSTAIGATDAVSLVYIAGVTGYFGNANLNFA